MTAEFNLLNVSSAICVVTFATTALGLALTWLGRSSRFTKNRLTRLLGGATPAARSQLRTVASRCTKSSASGSNSPLSSHRSERCLTR